MASDYSFGQHNLEYIPEPRRKWRFQMILVLEESTSIPHLEMADNFLLLKLQSWKVVVMRTFNSSS